MDELRWFFADSNRVELCECINIDYADVQISQSTGAQITENTWQIKLSESAWKRNPVTVGDYAYCPRTEIGGPITVIEHNTESRQITLSGLNWRGMLFQRAIEPPAGEGYLEFRNVDALQMVRDVIGNHFGNRVRVDSGDAGVLVSAKFRYNTVANGLQNALRSYGLKLVLTYNNVDNVLEISVDSVNTISDIVEFSQDYGVDFEAKKGNLESTNHCLALGQGELANRTVLNVYRVGNTFYDARPPELAESDIKTVVLDYPNAESEGELRASAISQLRETAPKEQLTINRLDAYGEIGIGDIVGIRDRLIGVVASAEVVGKIYKVSKGKTTETISVVSVVGA